MEHSQQLPIVTVALIGNPNTGKSTLLGALVGVQQRVGNYPGVTVEKKSGDFTSGGRRYHVIDLPGLYSLSPRGRDEMVVVDALLGRIEDVPPIDAVVCVADASNLERNLYLVSQVLELRLPTIIALNKVDLAEEHGAAVDVEELRRRVPVPVVPTRANRRLGVDDLREALDRLEPGHGPEPEAVLPGPFEREVAALAPAVDDLRRGGEARVSSRWLASRLLLDCGGCLEAALLGRRWRRGHCGRHGGHGKSRGQGRGRGRGGDARSDALAEQLDAARERLRQQDVPLPGVEAEVRYAWARRVLDGVISAPAGHRTTPSDRLDHVLTHPVWGTALFALVMFFVFQAVFSWSAPLVDLMNAGIDALGQSIVRGLDGTAWAGGAVESLLVGGVLGGVGGVLGFLPQILILFLFIALLEQCGYMARAAFLMDRLMACVGLSGHSFIPLLCCYGCAVPGIMATRVIGDERSRLATILVAPLTTCPARLPVYTVLIGACVPWRPYWGGLVNLQGLVLASFYALGVLTVVVASLVLRWTVLKGQALPLLMEMPPYEWPSVRVALARVVERGWLFVRSAGTVILAVSIFVWAAMYFPRSPDGDASFRQQSILARLGRVIEPAVRPLGWDWRIGSAVLASFPQREAVVATLGVIFSQPDGAGDAADDSASSLASRLREATWEDSDRPLFTLPTALSLMVFYTLCIQCVATLAAIRRETGSWRWPAVAFGYLTALAYIGALVTYQLGTWLAGG